MSFQVLKNLLNYLQEEEVRMSKSDADCKWHSLYSKALRAVLNRNHKTWCVFGTEIRKVPSSLTLHLSTNYLQPWLL